MLSSVVAVSSPDRLALSNIGLSLYETMWCLFRSRSTLGTILGWGTVNSKQNTCTFHYLANLLHSVCPPFSAGTCSDELCCEVPPWRPVQPPTPPRLLHLYHQRCPQHTECRLHGEQLWCVYSVCACTTALVPIDHIPLFSPPPLSTHTREVVPDLFVTTAVLWTLVLVGPWCIPVASHTTTRGCLPPVEHDTSWSPLLIPSLITAINS